MPAALILDDDRRHHYQNMTLMMMASPPTPTVAVVKSGTPQSTSGVSAVAAVPIPLDDTQQHDAVMSGHDCLPASQSEEAQQPPQPPRHGSITPPPVSILPTALAILNSPSADLVDYLNVMRALPWEPHIQRLALEKLWVATFDDEEALRLGQVVGGIPLVLEAMARFPAYEQLQHCACEVLQNVAVDHATEICHSGGVSFVVGAMRHHPHHSGLQLCGCITLTSLAEANPGHIDTIREAGGLDVVLQNCGCEEQAVAMGARQALDALGYDCYDEDDDDEEDLL